MRPDAASTQWLARWDQDHADGVRVLNDLLTLLTPMMRSEGRALATLALNDLLADWPSCKVIGLAALATTELAAARDGGTS